MGGPLCSICCLCQGELGKRVRYKGDSRERRGIERQKEKEKEREREIFCLNLL